MKNKVVRKPYRVECEQFVFEDFDTLPLALDEAASLSAESDLPVRVVDNRIEIIHVVVSRLGVVSWQSVTP